MRRSDPRGAAAAWANELLKRVPLVFGHCEPVSLDPADLESASQEMYDYTDLLKGKHWSEIDPHELGWAKDALIWFSPSNAARVLPSYIVSVLTNPFIVEDDGSIDPDSANYQIWESLMSRLTPRTREQWSPGGYQSFFYKPVSRAEDEGFEDMVQALNTEQREFVASVLYCLQEIIEPEDNPGDPLVQSPIHFALDTYWGRFG